MQQFTFPLGGRWREREALASRMTNEGQFNNELSPHPPQAVPLPPKGEGKKKGKQAPPSPPRGKARREMAYVIPFPNGERQGEK